jgi:hypothetical protein
VRTDKAHNVGTGARRARKDRSEPTPNFQQHIGPAIPTMLHRNAPQHPLSFRKIPTSWLSRIPVRANLLLLLLVFSSGIADVALAGWVALSRMLVTAQHPVETEFTSATTLGEIRTGVGNMRHFEKDWFLNLAHEDDVERYRLSRREQAESVRSPLTSIEPQLHENERTSLQKTRSGIADYEKVVESVLVGISRGEVNDPWRANQLLEPSKGDTRAADGALAEIAESLNRRVDRAAKEVKVLIGTSVDEVQAGGRLVNHAGMTMDDIVQSMEKVSGLVGGTSSSSEEQQGGIGQINSSIAQLDQMTQQNATPFEESAAAAESLRTQAQRLEERGRDSPGSVLTRQAGSA